MASLKEILRPPVFADEDTTRTATQLNAILLVTAVSLTTLTLIMVVGNEMRFRLNTTILSAMVVLMVALLVILRRGHVRFASNTFLIVSWFGLAYLAWNAEGVRDSAYIAVFVLILAAGLLVGWRAALFFTALSIATGWALAYGETVGHIVSESDTPFSQAQELTFVFIIVGLLVYLIISSLQQNLKQARQSNQELAVFSAQLEDRVAARTRDLNLAAQIGQEISQVRSMDHLLPQAVQFIYETFNPYQVQVYLTDAVQQYLVLRASTGYAGTELLTAGHQLPLDESSLNGTAVIQKQAVIVGDTSQSHLFRPNPLLPDTRSEMVIPLIVGEDVLGVLDLQSSQSGGLTEENLPAFTVLAGQLAIAILNARQNEEIRRSQEAMRANEALLRTIIDSTPDWIFVKDTSHRYQLVNQGYANSIGIDPDSFIGKDDLELGFPEEIVKGDPEKGILGFWGGDREIMVSGEMKIIDEEPAVVNGEARTLNTIKVPLKDADGTVTGIVGFVHDITSLKEAQTLLRKEQERIFTILESISIPIVVSRIQDGKVLYLNDPMAAAIRTARVSLVGQATPDFYSNPQEREAYLEALRRDGFVHNREMKMKRADGDAYWALVSSRVIEFENETAILTTAPDITDRITAEADIVRRADELSLVAGVATAAATLLDPDDLLQEVVNLTKSSFDLYHAQIYLLDDLSFDLVLTAGAGDVGQQMVKNGVRIPFDQEQSLVARAARDGEGVIVNNVHADPGFLPNPLLPHTQSEMSVPMMIGGLLLGVLDVQSEQVGRFATEDITIFTTLAVQVAVALQNADQYRETQNALATVEIFQQLAAATGEGLGIATLQGEVTYANPALLALLNVENQEKELYGRSLSQFYPETMQQRFQEEILPALLAESAWKGEGEIRLGDMPTITYENYFVLRDEAGKPSQIGMLISDITDRKHIEETIRANQNLMRTIINATPDWIIVKNTDNRFALVNQAYADYVGQPVEEIIGKNDIEVGFDEELVKGNPEKGIPGFWPDDQAVMESGRMRLYVEDELRIGDVVRYNSTVKTPLKDEAGQVTGLVVFVHDITSQKTAQLEQEHLAQELEEQLAQVNALQRAMTREGWQAFLVNQDRGATGFAYSGTTVEAFNESSRQEMIGDLALDLDEISEIAYDEGQTAVTLPLKIHGESVGVMGARNANGSPLTAEQQMLLTTLTVQVAEALERARLFETTELGRQEIEHQAAELSTVNEISELVSSQLNLNDLTNAVGDRLLDTFMARSVYIALIDGKSKAITFPYFVNREDGPITNIPVRTVDDSGGFTGQIYKTRQPLLHHFVDEDAIEAVGGQKIGAGRVSDSFMGAPMIVGDQVIGVIGLNGLKELRQYTESDIPLLSTLSSTIAVAIQNTLQFEETQRRANREALVNEISQKIQNAQTVESALQTAVTELGKALGIQRAIVELKTNQPEPAKPTNGHQA